MLFFISALFFKKKLILIRANKLFESKWDIHPV